MWTEENEAGFLLSLKDVRTGHSCITGKVNNLAVSQISCLHFHQVNEVRASDVLYQVRRNMGDDPKDRGNFCAGGWEDAPPALRDFSSSDTVRAGTAVDSRGRAGTFVVTKK